MNNMNSNNYININSLFNLSITELIIFSNNLGLKNVYFTNKEQLLLNLIYNTFNYNNIILGLGVLEIIKENFGFLRFKYNSYLPTLTDVFVSPYYIRRFNLKTGDTILGNIRLPKRVERYLSLTRIIHINYDNPYKLINHIVFEHLTPLHANYRLKMMVNNNSSYNKKKYSYNKRRNYNKFSLKKKFNDNRFYNKSKINKKLINYDLIGRILDLTLCIGKGQRGLIISPPKVGKTILLKNIAKGIKFNHPECILIILLIDERPEEVTEMSNLVKKIGGEVISSTFDEPSIKQIKISEIVLEKAKRLVEHKKDVVILLDSITRLARAYNTVVPNSGKVLTGGIDSNALSKPKKFFGSARNIQEGGSLTIIATALIETGSKMDDIIYEEFKGTGNMEICLSKKIAEKRIYPAIDYKKTGARKEELLILNNELKKMWYLRKQLNTMDEIEIIEFFNDKLNVIQTNEEFLDYMEYYN